MSKKVSKAFLVGERSFRAGGDVIHVPAGRHDVDEFLTQFPKEDRLGVALLAKNQGVGLEYEAEYVEETALSPADSPSFADVAASLPASEPPVEAPKPPAAHVPETTVRKRTRKK